MNKNINISVGWLITTLIALFLGYLWGRSTVEIPKSEKIVEVKREKGEVVRDTVDRLIPYRVEVPVDRPIFIPTDTLALFAIWQDYYLKRDYNLDFSNAELGEFKVDVSVNQNKLSSAHAFIQPNVMTVKEKEIIYKVPTVQPWVMLGSSVDFHANKIQFGLDIKNKYSVGVSGIRLNEHQGYTIDLGIKF